MLKRLAAIVPIALLLVLVGAAPAFAAEPTTISGAPSPTTATAGTAITVSDTVTLTGATTVPTGTVDFTFFNNDTCTGPQVLGGAGSTFTPTTGTSVTSTFSASWTPVEGTYFWRATYSGDTDNNPASTACNEASQRVVVTAAPPPALATPVLTAVADPREVIEGEDVTLNVVATLAGGDAPTGDVLFALFDNDACDGIPVLVDIAPLVGATATLSAEVTPEGAGEYFWYAAYEGDAKNEEAETECDDLDTLLVVQAAAVDEVEEDVVTTVGLPAGPAAESGAGGGAPELPATGAPVTELLVAGFALVGLGLVMVRVGWLPQPIAFSPLAPPVSEASARLAASLQHLREMTGLKPLA